MATHTNPQTQAHEPFVKAFYDLLMEKIEPELTSTVVPHLDDWFAGESAEERTERAARYEKAFATIDTQMGTLVGAWKKEIAELKKNVMAHLESDNATKEEAEMSSITNSIDAA